MLKATKLLALSALTLIFSLCLTSALLNEPIAAHAGANGQILVLNRISNPTAYNIVITGHNQFDQVVTWKDHYGSVSGGVSLTTWNWWWKDVVTIDLYDFNNKYLGSYWVRIPDNNPSDFYQVRI